MSSALALVHRRFEFQAHRRPNAVAVECAGIRLTYWELNERADLLAETLALFGVNEDRPVGLFAERSVDVAIGVLGILKAGGAYCPLDPSWPKARLALLIDETRPPVIVAQSHLSDRLPACAAHILPVQDVSAARAANHRSVRRQSPDSLAYLPFTSGSTGHPKGVAIRHRSIVRLVCENDYAEFGSHHVFLQLAPLAFDASTFEIWGALLHGAKLVIAPPGTPTLPELGRLLRDAGVTTLWLTAGLFHLMAQERLDDFAGLRQLLAGGDALSPAVVRRVRERFPELRLINGYGPTEATTFACCHTIGHVPEHATSVPIGRPIAGTRVVIVPDRQDVPETEVEQNGLAEEGELYIGGDGLARGYWNRDELTAERFVVDPTDPDSRLYRTGDRVRRRADGLLEFSGRIDRQIKIRGFRIELGEIEAILLEHPGIAQAVVVAREGRPGEKRLVAYVVPKRSDSANELREYLQRLLPDYMLPSAIVLLSELPLTPNGKVDRDRLPTDTRYDPTDGPTAVPRSTIERMQHIWETVLTGRRATLDVPFLEAGGDSLLGLKLLNAIEREFGRCLGLDAVLNGGTIAALAAGLERPSLPRRALVPLQPHGGRLPFYLVHPLGGQVMGFRSLIPHLRRDQPLFGLQANGEPGVDLTIEEMARRYLAEVRDRQPAGPYCLGGYSMGAFVALEMARQLLAADQEVGLLAAIDDGPAFLRDRQGKSLAELHGFFANLPRWIRHTITHRQPREILRDTLRKLGRTKGGALERVLDPSRFAPALLPIMQAHYRAVARYEPRPFPGSVTLFRARIQSPFGPHCPHLGWSEVTEKLTIHHVPGNHDALITEPSVSILGAQLAAELGSVELLRVRKAG